MESYISKLKMTINISLKAKKIWFKDTSTRRNTIKQVVTITLFSRQLSCFNLK